MENSLFVRHDVLPEELSGRKNKKERKEVEKKLNHEISSKDVSVCIEQSRQYF